MPKQFVEACLSYGGVKTVNAVECQSKAIIQSVRFQFKNIKLFRNFCLKRQCIVIFRAWNVGEGLLLPYNKLIDEVRCLKTYYYDAPSLHKLCFKPFHLLQFKEE